MRKGGVRVRASLGAAAASLLIFSGGAWVVREWVHDQWTTVARDNATRDAFTITSAIENGRTPGGLESDAAVFLQDGRQVAYGGTKRNVPKAVVRLPEGRGWGTGTAQTRGGGTERFVIASTDVLSSGRLQQLTGQAGLTPQRVTVDVLISRRDATAAVSAVDTTLAWSLPITVLFVGLVAWTVTGRALRPVRAIRAEMAEISAGAADRRVPVPDTGDEIADLARTTNETLGRLEHALDQQRRFVGDASHELRTPLAGMRNTLEVALTHPAESDWPAIVSTALADTVRLQHTADDLLLLTSSSDTPEGTVTDLAEIVEEQVAERAFQSSGPVTFTAHTSGPALVAESEQRIARIVRNLLDNAARHAREAVTVTVSVEDGEEDGEVVLTVVDDGPGIPAADRERVFDRFVRLDSARSHADGGGAGLGLAIVAELSATLGGTAHAEEAPNGGAVIVVRLPSRAPAEVS